MSIFSGCLSTFSSSNSDTPLPNIPTGAWTQYGADGANTFTPNASAPSSGNLAWTSDAFTRWQPVVSDGTVYMTNFDPSNDGSVIGLDAQGGSEEWRTTLNASGDNGTVIVDDRFIVAYDSELVALDSQSGEQIWTEPINRFDFSELLVVDEATRTVLVGSRAGIEAFNAANGEKLWEINTVRQIARAPAIYDGEGFVVGYIDGTPFLVAFSLEDGSELWRSELTSIPESTPPVVTQERVFVSESRVLVAYNRETGDRYRELHSFSYDEGKYEINGIAATDSVVFATSHDGIVAMDSESGTERWHRNAVAGHSGICVGTETVVLPLRDPEFAPNKETISALDRESGEMYWYYTFDSSPNVIVPPVLVDGAVFFTASDMDGLGALGDVSAQDS
ncbi:outer membrane protein assembly factor BamB family protein [Haloarcula laminariae]|uniref:outer membrane protein assembly factor BamB family protein n=1 Tax=Haloarcula laminariae TaxID=2961577 RepID=UPI00240708CE|nr:PQQ-binding-like beta-propeller repeat protein [Halomicroarcula sp. FL173]